MSGMPAWWWVATSIQTWVSGPDGALLATPLIVLRDVAKVPTFWILFFSFYICVCVFNYF